MIHRFMVALSAGVLLLAGLATGPARASDTPAPDPRTVVSDVEKYLSFVAGVPLSAADRERVAAQTAADLRSDPGAIRKIDANVRTALDKIETGDASFVAGRRETTRLEFALLPESNLGHEVVERTDPTIVFDRKHHRLVTEATLRALQHGGTRLAQILDVPAPDAGQVATARTFLRAHYDSLTDEQQETVAHLERDLPVFDSVYGKADGKKQAQFVKQLRPYALKPEQLLPITVAVLAATNAAVEDQSVHDSILLMSAMNYGRLYHQSYYHL